MVLALCTPQRDLALGVKIGPPSSVLKKLILHFIKDPRPKNSFHCMHKKIFPQKPEKYFPKGSSVFSESPEKVGL